MVQAGGLPSGVVDITLAFHGCRSIMLPSLSLCVCLGSPLLIEHSPAGEDNRPAQGPPPSLTLPAKDPLFQTPSAQSPGGFRSSRTQITAHLWVTLAVWQQRGQVFCGGIRAHLQWHHGARSCNNEKVISRVCGRRVRLCLAALNVSSFQEDLGHDGLWWLKGPELGLEQSSVLLGNRRWRGRRGGCGSQPLWWGR